jgi:hypothetical protein
MITENMDTLLAFYSQPSVMSTTGKYTPLIQALPASVPELVEVLQGLAVHIFWAQRYGLALNEARQAEVQIRAVQPKLARLFEIDPRPLTEARPPELRLVCNCRDFSLLLASMLKVHGIACRARCGFGTYFLPDHYEDHWMTEYWQPDASIPGAGRWVQVDAQIDGLQREALGISFNTLDMPDGQFVLAGKAWQMCRAGSANPDDFGIFEWHGWDFIKGNLLRDLLSLNKIELLPWDDWGILSTPYTELINAQTELLDRVAWLTLQGNDSFQEVRAIYESNPNFHAPQELCQG